MPYWDIIFHKIKIILTSSIPLNAKLYSNSSENIYHECTNIEGINYD